MPRVSHQTFICLLHVAACVWASGCVRGSPERGSPEIEQGLAIWLEAYEDNEEPSLFMLEAHAPVPAAELDDEQIGSAPIAATPCDVADNAWLELSLDAGSYSAFLRITSTESGNIDMLCDADAADPVACPLVIEQGTVKTFDEEDLQTWFSISEDPSPACNG